jgi:serine protease Do
MMGKIITMSRRFIRRRRVSGSLLPGQIFLVSLFFLLLAGLMSQERLPFFPLPAQAAEKEEKPTDLSTAIIKVARQAIPAVVHIEVTSRQEVANPMLPFENDPFFRHFFNVPKMPKKFKRELKGLGTGIIIDDQGRILTNNHVVQGANKVEVTLADGSRFPAELIGTDPKTDLAVIRISAKERLPFLTLGDSDKVEVGEWVVAIGHPRGLDQTVTQGIISAKHRRGITDPSSYQDFLQTDTAINPGNSGGPLLTLRGEVIGVNSVIASESGGFEGIGFAIPSNMALHISKILMAHGKVERGWFGVSIQNLTPEQVQKTHLPGPRGALVVEVVKGGPADKAGIRKDDIVLAYQGKEIRDANEFRNLVAMTPVGEEARVTLWRDGKKLEVAVKIGNLEESTKILAATAQERLGVSVRPVTPKEAEKFGLSPQQGVAIVAVDAKGPLGEAGFEVEDILLGINNQPVTGLESFVSLVSSLKPQEKVSVVALDHRTGSQGAVEVTAR